MSQPATTLTAEEARLTSLRHLAQRYSDTNTPRAHLLALHAHILADTLQAKQLDPTFTTSNLRDFAEGDDETDGDYTGYTADTWIELWRFYIHDTISEEKREAWLNIIPPRQADQYDLAVDDRAETPQHSHTLGAWTDYERQTQRLREETEAALARANELAHANDHAAYAEGLKATILTFQTATLQAAHEEEDTLYAQADMVYDLSLQLLKRTPAPTTKNQLAHIQAKLAWLAPTEQQQRLIREFAHILTQLGE